MTARAISDALLRDMIETMLSETTTLRESVPRIVFINRHFYPDH